MVHVITTNNMSNAYEETMLKLIKSYLSVHTNSFDLSTWNDFACFIGINFDLIKALVEHPSDERCFDDEVEQRYGYQIFECVLNYYFVRKSLNQIKIDCSRLSLIENLKLYYSITHNVCMMNVNAGSYECMCNNAFSREHAPQSFESFHPSDYINRLNAYAFYNDFYERNNKFLPILYNIINYQLLTHSNAMVLIIITRIMKHSDLLNPTIKNIASELYNSLHIILKDARVILVQPNFLYLDVLKEPSLRTKKGDNTTRLHIVYGYDNYDTYSLRLDFCHKGINWIHYNNQSPGGVKSFVFTKQEYEDIVTKKPNMQKCFIAQNEVYFLKEKKNCELSHDEAQNFDDIESSKVHSKVFCNNYSESDTLSFITLLSDFFFNICHSTVDKAETASRYAFNLDFLMCRLDLYYLCLFSLQDKAESLYSIIIDRAVDYKLIDSKDKAAYDSLEGLQMIIELAKERCDNLI